MSIAKHCGWSPRCVRVDDRARACHKIGLIPFSLLEYFERLELLSGLASDFRTAIARAIEWARKIGLTASGL
jgi:hypothetical protein